MRQLYAKFRISPAFLLILFAFILTSIVAHRLWSYDADWTITNLVLSFEASLSVCIFMQDSANFEQYVRDQQRMHAENLARIESMAATGQSQTLLTSKMIEGVLEHWSKTTSAVNSADAEHTASSST